MKETGSGIWKVCVNEDAIAYGIDNEKSARVAYETAVATLKIAGFVISDKPSMSGATFAAGENVAIDKKGGRGNIRFFRIDGSVRVESYGGRYMDFELSELCKLNEKTDGSENVMDWVTLERLVTDESENERFEYATVSLIKN